MDFTEFDLPQFLTDNIKEEGWTRPTPIQTLVMGPALEGADVMGGAPTGTGKSAAFLLPLIARLSSKPQTGIKVLIVEPTRELCMQVHECAIRLSQGSAISCGLVIGGSDREAQKDLKSNILTATPGRLKELTDKGFIDLSTVESMVIDEADRMLDMGFSDEVSALCKAVSKRRQTLLFSATLEGRDIEAFAEAVLHDPYEVRLGAGDDGRLLPATLKNRAYYAENDRKKPLILLTLLTTTNARSIIFVRTKDRLKELCGVLRKNNFTFATLQGDFAQNERTAAIRRFKEGQVSLLVATDVAARGLDLPEVQYVYNYDLPRQVITYIHRAGRTARAEQKGVVASIVERPEIALMEKIERYCNCEIERRQIKGLCGEFPAALPTVKEKEKNKEREETDEKSSRKKGSFGVRHSAPKDKKVKVRHRVLKNKGKPDFKAKRARKAARLAATLQQPQGSEDA